MLIRRAVLQPRGPAAAVVLTDEQLAEIGGGAKTPPVRVSVDGQTFQGRIGRMRGETLVGFNKANRELCGVAAGDEIDVEIVLDEGPREVELPSELEAALAADPAARAAFDALAPSRRKELARTIADAKKPETREKRLAAALASLSA